MNLLKAVATISSLTLVSRVLGFVRDMFIARAFGAGMATDAFFVAFRLPNLLRRLFAEGAFSQAFVPILGEYKNTKTEDDTHKLVDKMATLLFLTVFLVTVIGVIAAPVIIYVTAPGFTEDTTKFDLSVTMLRITFPYILFMSLVAFSGAILNTYSRFSVPAITPALLNISFIVFTVFISPYFEVPIISLAVAVFVGGILQLAIQVPTLIKIGMMPRFDLLFKDPGVKRILRLMAPAILGVSVSQLSIIINTILASFLVDGSVSWLYYADRLMEFPTGLLGVALGTVLLPNLSKCHATNDHAEYQQLLDWGLRLVCLLSLPAAVGLAVAGTPLIATLFLYGQFQPDDLLMTQTALLGYAIGLPALISVKVLAPAFYAKQNIKTPVKIAIVSLIATQCFNLLLISSLQHVALAVSISLAAIINAGILLRLLIKHKIYIPQPGWPGFLLKLLLAATLMGLTAWLLSPNTVFWIQANMIDRVLQLSLLVGSAALVYFASLYIMGIRLKSFIRITPQT